jgi:hypothetical protein
MRLIGQILLWVGFLAGAFSAVYRLEVPDRKWQTVPWIGYGAAVAVGVVGIVLLRSTAKQQGLQSAGSERKWETLQQSLSTIVAAMKELRESQHRMTPHQIVAFIDNRLVEPLAAFAESRDGLIERDGLQYYADVMTQFASAERFINRAWSAAADGYVDEVSASLERADSHLTEAQRLMNLER